jgi:hypothetical protein
VKETREGGFGIIIAETRACVIAIIWLNQKMGPKDEYD